MGLLAFCPNISVLTGLIACVLTWLIQAYVLINWSLAFCGETIKIKFTVSLKSRCTISVQTSHSYSTRRNDLDISLCPKAFY